MRVALGIILLLALAAGAREGEFLRDRAGVVPVRARLAPFPARPGRAHVTVDVDQARRLPVNLLLDLPAEPERPVVRQACRPTGPQRFEADLAFPQAGRWRIRVEVGTPSGNFQLVSLLDVGVSPSVSRPPAELPTPTPRPTVSVSPVPEPSLAVPATPSRAWLLGLALAPLLVAAALRRRPVAAGLALVAGSALGGALALRLWPPAGGAVAPAPSLARAPVPVVEVMVGRLPFAVERSYPARVLAVRERVVQAGPGKLETLLPVGWRARRGELLARVGSQRILAPEDGVVVRWYAEPGAVLAAGSSLVALADDRTVRVQALGTSTDVLLPGSPVTVLDGMAAVRGRLARVQPPEAVISNRMPASKGMAPAPASTRPQPMFVLGQEVTLRCQMAQRSEALCVPRSAVSGQAVYVVEGGVAHRRAVETGLSNDSHTEILSGLREGETVVAVADEDLRDGVAVAPSWATGAYRQRLQPQSGAGH